MTKFESSVKVIPYSQERVYEKLADLSNLEAIKDRLPEDKVKNMSFDTDTLSFNLPFNMWIQLVAVSEEECKLKVTIGLEINPFMKAMVQKPLNEGLEKMADMLSMIQY